MKINNLCLRMAIAATFLTFQLLSVRRGVAQTPPRDNTFGVKGASFLNLYDSLSGLGMVNDYVLDNGGNMYFLIPRSLMETNAISDNDGLVIKINSAGNPDLSFNGMGYAVIHNLTLTTIWQQPYRWGTYLRVAGDGSTITVYSGQPGNIINSFRLTGNGLPDYSYGAKGCRNIPLPSTMGVLQDVRQTADGGVLLYSARGIATDSLLYSITKLTPAGDIDVSFNKTGTATVHLPGDINTSYYVESLFLPAGGFLMETRTAHYLDNTLYALNWIKFTANGSVDSSYGKNGAASIPVQRYTFAYQSSSAHNILLPDNSLLSMLLYNNRLLQFKLTPGGKIDSSFGIKGMNISGFGNTTNFIGRYTDPSSLYFWTNRNVTDSTGYVSMRIKPDGTIDSSFIHTSLLSNPFYRVPAPYGQFDQYALVSGQYMLGAWTYGINGFINNGTLRLARLDQNAVIDHSFGVAGQALFTNGVSNDQLITIAPLNDGRMIAIGTDGIKSRMFRVNNNGRLDKTFGNGQKLVTLFNSFNSFGGLADLKIDSKSRIVVGIPNYVVNSLNQLILSRYTTEGQLDPSFGQGGSIMVNNQLNSNETLEYNKFTVQPDNKILVLYERVKATPQTSIVAILRLNEDGSVDNSFGSNGWSYLNYRYDYPETILVLHDGSILISGTYQDGNSQYLAKLNASGQQLTSVGTNGFAFTVQGTSDDHVFFLGETDSGKIVYAVTGRDYTSNNFTLAGRLNSDLSYDQKASLFYIYGDRFSSAQLLHDGRLVVTGMHNTVSSPPHLAMVITKTNLSIDSLVGENGFLTYSDVLPDTLTQTNPYSSTSTDPNRGYAYNQVICFKDANGQIVTAATAKRDSLSDVFLIRHLFNDTASTFTPVVPVTPVTPVSPQPNGSLIVWTRAFCPNVGIINITLYDSTGALVLTPNTPAMLDSTLKTAPGCGDPEGFTYTITAGNYTLKAYCGLNDSLVSLVTIPANGCIAKEVSFGVPPTTLPHDTTSNKPPNDTTARSPQIIAFPNPTKGTVDIHLPAQDNGNILIADMTGRIVLNAVFNGKDVTVNLGNLEKGYYMVQVKGKQYRGTLTVLRL